MRIRCFITFQHLPLLVSIDFLLLSVMQPCDVLRYPLEDSRSDFEEDLESASPAPLPPMDNPLPQSTIDAAEAIELIEDACT